MLILGIESSCDETAAAIVQDGTRLLSSVISSQIDIHKEWGGVVPELASREHLVKIDEIVKVALIDADKCIGEVDAIAVTQGPGLVGSLLVGVSYAKGLALASGKPCIPVNHIEGHFYSTVFDYGLNEYPVLALIVSGGHTNLFYSPKPGKYSLVSRTRDDAAGEAFDKVSKMLGLGYPGGPIIEKIARQGDSDKIDFPIPKISDGRPDFSFSGLKTAVMRYLRVHEIEPVRAGTEISQEIKDVCASFQATVVRSLIGVLIRQAKELKPRTLIVAGGVASNGALRKNAEEAAQNLGIPIRFPSKHLSTDNAAMIAAAGYFNFKNDGFFDLSFGADVRMRLQNLNVEDEKLRKKNVRYKL
ncbi:MAG: tRNA (adenosine(37)-N6)-threonylcarbamoyltransferase complex transferase subunit TsaD [Pyrinomonadaceae bacterium]